jgi:hypothetical protein
LTPALAAQPGALFNLSGQIFELLEERDAIAAEVRECEGLAASVQTDTARARELLEQSRAELDAINSAIARFVQTKLQEVDELRTPILALERAVEANKADARDATNRAIEMQNRCDRLKDMVKLAMETLAANGYWKPKQTKKFESARGVITLRGNGGVQPVEITDEAMVPNEYWRVTVTMSYDLWSTISHEVTGPTLGRMCTISERREVSRSLVAEALAKPCGTCKGDTEWTGTSDDDIRCPDCGGTGTQGVPGARLVSRGTSLQVK